MEILLLAPLAALVETVLPETTQLRQPLCTLKVEVLLKAVPTALVVTQRTLLGAMQRVVVLMRPDIMLQAPAHWMPLGAAPRAMETYLQPAEGQRAAKLCALAVHMQLMEMPKLAMLTQPAVLPALVVLITPAAY